MGISIIAKADGGRKGIQTFQLPSPFHIRSGRHRPDAVDAGRVWRRLGAFVFLPLSVECIDLLRMHQIWHTGSWHEAEHRVEEATSWRGRGTRQLLGYTHSTTLQGLAIHVWDSPLTDGSDTPLWNLAGCGTSKWKGGEDREKWKGFFFPSCVIFIDMVTQT